MNVPTFLRQQYVNLQTGYLTDPVQSYHDQLNQQLQFSFSNSGLVVPSLNSQSIQNSTNANNPNAKPNGTIFYNNETGEPQIKVNGQVKTIQTV